MHFPDDAPVTLAKRAALRGRIRHLGIELAAVEEQAIRACGPGGQKVNKTSSGVLLRYRLPSQREGEEGELLVIKWTRERHHALNRFLALRELVDEVEARLSPETSARRVEEMRIRKQKDRARRRRR